MFKLLSDTARQKVSTEYHLRRVIVIMIGITIVLLVGIIVLIPSYILSVSHENVALSRIEALKNSPTQHTSVELVSWLVETNQKLALLSPSMNNDSPYENFQKIIVVKPTGVTLQKFSLTKDKKEITIFIQGTASDRNVLLDFQNRLNTSGNFSKATLPVSSFAKDKDINFDISLAVIK